MVAQFHQNLKEFKYNKEVNSGNEFKSLGENMLRDNEERVKKCDKVKLQHSSSSNNLEFKELNENSNTSECAKVNSYRKNSRQNIDEKNLD